MKITGTITDAARGALSGYRVVAYHGDVNLKKERNLGPGRTDETGAFALAVDLARYPLGVNVRVAVLDGGSNGALVQSDPLQRQDRSGDRRDDSRREARDHRIPPSDG